MRGVTPLTLTSLFWASTIASQQQSLQFTDSKGQRRALDEVAANAEFHPLKCNALLDNEVCIPAPVTTDTALSYTEVPCGECWTLSPGNYNFKDGLNIIGKLVIPAGDSSTSITTPFIFVQGKWEISTTDKIPSLTQQVHVTITGDDMVTFTRYDDGTPDAPCLNGCNPSLRPIIVAGGVLKVSGMAQTCPAWVKVHSMVSHVASVTDFPRAPVISEECKSVTNLISCDFKTTCTGKEVKGFGKSRISVKRGILKQMKRGASFSGPMIEIDKDMLGCIDTHAQFKLQTEMAMILDRKEIKAGTKTSCQMAGRNCPTMFVIHRNAAGKWNNRIIGSIAGNIVNNKYYDFTSEVFSFTDAELDVTNKVLVVLVSGPEANVDIYFKHFEMNMITDGIYPDPDAPCDDLIVHGSVGDFPSTLPWVNAGGVLFVANDADGTAYYRHSERDRGGFAFKQDIQIPACVTRGSIYKYSMTSRVNTTETGFKITPYMRVMSEGEPRGRWIPMVDCPTQSNGDGWVTCEGDFKMSRWVNVATSMQLYIMSNLGGDIDYKELSLKFVTNEREQKLIVPDSVTECWDVGAEVMLSSQTIDHFAELVTKVTSITPEGNGMVALGLEDSAQRWIVKEEEQEFSKPELALLSRNIVFKGDGEHVKEKGAHLQVFHTPNQVQSINGIEFKNMGQLGEKGRYPLHLHMNGVLKDTTLSKNVVRDSFQRCYVIHGTHNVLLYDNIAYNTTGHCFFFEDGCEIDNVLDRNLGARTLVAEKLVGDDETDDEPSTYWLSNGDNWVRNNVATGSEGHGFWYEMKRVVRGICGELDEFKSVDPQAVNLKQCENNYAHSNKRHGFTTYPGAGYKPKDHGVFRDNWSYRNRMSGVFFHNSGNVGVQGGIVTDNRVGVDVDRAHSISIRDVHIMGYSDDFRAIITEGGTQFTWRDWICPGELPIYGVHDHPYYFGASLAKGTTISNITVTHYEDIGCDGSTPMSVDDFEDLGFFDPRTNYQGVTFEDGVRRIELCSAKEGGVDYVAIQDLDGSVMGEPGLIVTDSDKMNFVGWDTECTSHPEDCMKTCPGKCLRTLGIFTHILTNSNFTLEITGDEIDGAVKVKGYFDIENDGEDPSPFQLTMAHFTRKFFVTLPPGGNYNAKFYLDGEHAWPTFAAVGYEDAPGGCGANFTSFVIERPPVTADTCANLIEGGDFEDGTTGLWTHLADGLYLTEKAYAGSYALTSKYASTSNMALTYFLDTRCLTEGSTYEFSAMVTLADGEGKPKECADRCVVAWAMMFSGASDRTTSIELLGVMGSEYVAGWNKFTFTLTVDETMASFESVAVVLSRPPTGLFLMIDDISLTPVSAAA